MPSEFQGREFKSVSELVAIFNSSTLSIEDREYLRHLVEEMCAEFNRVSSGEPLGDRVSEILSLTQINDRNLCRTVLSTFLTTLSSGNPLMSLPVLRSITQIIWESPNLVTTEELVGILSIVVAKIGHQVELIEAVGKLAEALTNSKGLMKSAEFGEIYRVKDALIKHLREIAKANKENTYLRFKIDYTLQALARISKTGIHSYQVFAAFEAVKHFGRAGKAVAESVDTFGATAILGIADILEDLKKGGDRIKGMWKSRKLSWYQALGAFKLSLLKVLLHDYPKLAEPAQQEALFTEVERGIREICSDSSEIKIGIMELLYQISLETEHERVKGFCRHMILTTFQSSEKQEREKQVAEAIEEISRLPASKGKPVDQRYSLVSRAQKAVKDSLSKGGDPAPSVAAATVFETGSTTRTAILEKPVNLTGARVTVEQPLSVEEIEKVIAQTFRKLKAAGGARTSIVGPGAQVDSLTVKEEVKMVGLDMTFGSKQPSQAAGISRFSGLLSNQTIEDVKLISEIEWLIEKQYAGQALQTWTQEIQPYRSRVLTREERRELEGVRGQLIERLSPEQKEELEGKRKHGDFARPM